MQQETFAASVDQQIAEITANAPLTCALAKKALVEIERPEAERLFSKVTEALSACFTAGITGKVSVRFKEKRTPQFRGVQPMTDSLVIS